MKKKTAPKKRLKLVSSQKNPKPRKETPEILNKMFVAAGRDAVTTSLLELRDVFEGVYKIAVCDIMAGQLRTTPFKQLMQAAQAVVDRHDIDLTEL